MHGGLCCTSGLSASAALLYPSKRDANGGVGGGIQALPLQDRERVMLSVCLWERERESVGECVGICVCEAFPWQPVRGVFGPGREGERKMRRGENYPLLRVGGEWDKLMGKVGLPPPLCLPLPPYQPSTVYFLQPWQASFSLSLSHISNSVPLQGNFKACRVCVLCHMGGFLGNNQVHKTHLRKSPRHHRFLLT